MWVIRRLSVGPGGLDLGPRRASLPSRPLVIAVLSALALLASGCGSSTKSTTTAPTTTAGAATPTTGATPTPSATPTTSATAPAAGGLSGTWSGQYSGAYTGTFSLTWQQSGSNLTGTIKLSSPARTLGITGNVQGSAIRFGAVGGVAYSGSVSGSTMSGTYQTPGAPGSIGSGSWSAHKTS
jgi:hypothetical protein